MKLNKRVNNYFFIKETLNIDLSQHFYQVIITESVFLLTFYRTISETCGIVSEYNLSICWKLFY